MSVPPNLFLNAFREQHLGVMFAVLIAALVYLATLGMAAQGALATFSERWSQGVQGRLTVEVPQPDGGIADDQAANVEKITSALRGMPEIGRVTPWPETEIARLLSPWFTEGNVLASLPLPAMIDIDLKDATAQSARTVKEKITALDINLRATSQADGLGQLMFFVHGLRLIAAIVILLIAITLVIAISLIIRTAMALQKDTIELLHFMGATDFDIARQFLRHTRRLTFASTLTGFSIALATCLALLYMMRHFIVVPVTMPVWGPPLAVMTLVPLAAFVIALVVTRFSVLMLLRRMP